MRVPPKESEPQRLRVPWYRSEPNERRAPSCQSEPLYRESTSGLERAHTARESAIPGERSTPLESTIHQE